MLGSQILLKNLSLAFSLGQATSSPSSKAKSAEKKLILVHRAGPLRPTTRVPRGARKKNFLFLVDFFTRAAADFVEKEEMLFVYRKEEKLSAFCYQSTPLKLLRGIHSISYG